MEVRGQLAATWEAGVLRAAPPAIPDFRLLDQPLGTVEGRAG
jgi:hypothetical protein